MDRKTRDDGVELAQLWQACGQIMRNDSYRLVSAKLLAKRVQHGWRKIDCYEFRLRPGGLDQCQKSARTTTYVKNTFHIARQELEQRGLAFRTMRNRIRAAQVFQSMFW